MASASDGSHSTSAGDSELRHRGQAKTANAAFASSSSALSAGKDGAAAAEQHVDCETAMPITKITCFLAALVCLVVFGSYMLISTPFSPFSRAPVCTHPDTYSIHIYSDDFFHMLPSASQVVETIAFGFEWVEGPLFVDEAKSASSVSVPVLLFSDIPANRIYHWDEKENELTALVECCGTCNCTEMSIRTESGTNGLLIHPPTQTLWSLSHAGRYITAWDTRKDFSKVSSHSPKSKSSATSSNLRYPASCPCADQIHCSKDRASLSTSSQLSHLSGALNSTVVISHFESKRLNSPNDGIFRSDGSLLYFTDPSYGFQYRQPRDPSGKSGSKMADESTDDWWKRTQQVEWNPQREQSTNGVYLVRVQAPISTESTSNASPWLADIYRLSAFIRRPNGIALSSNERRLYVSSSDEHNLFIAHFDLDEQGWPTNSPNALASGSHRLSSIFTPFFNVSRVVQSIRKPVNPPSDYDSKLCNHASGTSPQVVAVSDRLSVTRSEVFDWRHLSSSDREELIASHFVGIGMVDGMKVLPNGVLVVGGPNGLYFLRESDGQVVGSVLTGRRTANVAIGRDGWIYFVVHDRVLRIQTTVKTHVLSAKLG